MKIFVANLGSTSFKYRLFDDAGGELAPIAKGSYERVEDHGVVIQDALEKLEAEGTVGSAADIDAVVFKTVVGGEVSGCREADETVLEALDALADIAPSHNPPYAEGIRQFGRRLPEATLVALFETSFYQWTGEAYRRYAVPEHWYEAGVRRYGFHGASHKFIAERSAALMGCEDVAERVRRLYHGDLQPVNDPAFRVISCHLGGSSSVTGIRDGLAIGTSMGLSPQGGLPQNNRAGDIDTMTIPLVMKRLGLDMETVERELTKESGLLGLSGVSNDIRDIKAAAADGNARAQLALDHFVWMIRHWVGAFWLQMGGCDTLVFTAGIGENHPFLREAVCAGLEEMGVKLDPEANAGGEAERCISKPESRTAVWIIPANEEAVLAAEAKRFLEKRKG